MKARLIRYVISLVVGGWIAWPGWSQGREGKDAGDLIRKLEFLNSYLVYMTNSPTLQFSLSAFSRRMLSILQGPLGAYRRILKESDGSRFEKFVKEGRLLAEKHFEWCSVNRRESLLLTVTYEEAAASTLKDILQRIEAKLANYLELTKNQKPIDLENPGLDLFGQALCQASMDGILDEFERLLKFLPSSL